MNLGYKREQGAGDTAGKPSTKYFIDSYNTLDSNSFPKETVQISFLRVKSFDCLVGLVVASATAELEVLGSIPGSDKVLLGFSIRNFSVAVTESGFVPG